MSELLVPDQNELRQFDRLNFVLQRSNEIRGNYPPSEHRTRILQGLGTIAIGAIHFYRDDAHDMATARSIINFYVKPTKVK